MKTTIANKNPATRQTITNRCLQSCQKLLAGIEQAKSKIISEFRPTREAQENLFKQAVNEAEALAWQTPYPHLFFPARAVEKVQAANPAAIGASTSTIVCRSRLIAVSRSINLNN
jgi:hypothetical protein